MPFLATEEQLREVALNSESRTNLNTQVNDVGKQAAFVTGNAINSQAMELDSDARMAADSIPNPSEAISVQPLNNVTLRPSRCPFKSAHGITPNLTARLSPYGQWEVILNMFGNGSVIFSIMEIKHFYPNQWVAIAVTETDADGFASKGEVIMHNSDEQFVWAAIKLGEAEDPVYVFYTGSWQRITAAA